MLFARFFWLQCRRFMSSIAFWLAVVIFAIVLLLNSVGEMENSDYVSVVYLFFYSMLQIKVLVLGVLPILPFGLSYLQERSEKSIRFFTIRSGLVAYVAAKFLAILLSGFLVVAMGFVLYGVTLSFFFPLYKGTSGGAGGTLEMWLESGRPVLYLAGYIYSYALTGALFSGLGFLFSTMTDDHFSAVMMPYLLYMVVALAVPLLHIPYQYSVTPWFLDFPYLDSAPTPVATLLAKTFSVGVALLVIGLYAFLRIERRLSNE
jgi:hypothetical protein